jgi:hypothetical protein
MTRRRCAAEAAYIDGALYRCPSCGHPLRARGYEAHVAALGDHWIFAAKCFDEYQRATAPRRLGRWPR